MKKIYINPTVECYIIQTRNNLLTTSNVSVSTDDFIETGPEAGEILGRDTELDDFEFDEEFADE